jgi:hypothetical protein
MMLHRTIILEQAGVVITIHPTTILEASGATTIHLMISLRTITPETVGAIQIHRVTLWTMILLVEAGAIIFRQITHQTITAMALQAGETIIPETPTITLVVLVDGEEIRTLVIPIQTQHQIQMTIMAVVVAGEPIIPICQTLMEIMAIQVGALREIPILKIIMNPTDGEITLEMPIPQTAVVTLDLVDGEITLGTRIGTTTPRVPSRGTLTPIMTPGVHRRILLLGVTHQQLRVLKAAMIITRVEETTRTTLVGMRGTEIIRVKKRTAPVGTCGKVTSQTVEEIIQTKTREVVGEATTDVTTTTLVEILGAETTRIITREVDGAGKTATPEQAGEQQEFIRPQPGFSPLASAYKVYLDFVDCRKRHC